MTIGNNMEIDKVGSLEDEALKRKERLKLLKRKHDSDSKNSEGQDQSLPKPVFRSYKPQDESLMESVLPEAEPGNVELQIKDQLEASNVKVVIDELDITNLAPKKPDWDLKRDVAKKLEKLERRTQKAIAELIWERLKQGEENNISAMVTLATDSQGKDTQE